MQTFLPYSDFQRVAEVLDWRRLGKQRVEGWQILQSLAQGPECPYDPIQKVWGWGQENLSERQEWRKTPWYNHPNVQQWKGYELLLMDYTCTMCEKWIDLGKVDNLKPRVLDLFGHNSYWLNQEEKPWWLGWEDYHSNHRAILLGKVYKDWLEAFSISTYKDECFKEEGYLNWYRQWGWSETPARMENNKWPYIWPTKVVDDYVSSNVQER